MIYSSIAVSNYKCNIIACSLDGFVYALGRDGSELWDFYTDSFINEPGSILASPLIAADGTIYVAGIYDPNLYALKPQDGSIKWACYFGDPCEPNSGKNAGWPFAAAAVSENGTIYQALVYDSNLYAIDAETGSIIWTLNLSDTNSGWFEPNYAPWDIQQRHPYHNVSDSAYSEPVLGPDGTIYVSFDDPYLRAVNPDGSIKWIAQFGQLGGFTLTVGSDSLIYAAGDDGCLRVINADGQQISKFQADAWLNFPKIQKNKTIIVSDGRDNSMFITDANNVVWAISENCEGNPPDLYQTLNIK
jgi:outer membrane protein assembly factor BamB